MTCKAVENLRLVAAWCEAKGVTDEEVIALGGRPWGAEAHLEFVALMRLWPDRVFDLQHSGHLRRFMDDGVEVICIVSRAEERQYAERLRLVEEEAVTNG